MAWWHWIIIVVLMFIAGYLIADYQAYNNLKGIIVTDQAQVAGKSWGIFKF